MPLARVYAMKFIDWVGSSSHCLIPHNTLVSRLRFGEVSFTTLAVAVAVAQ